MKKDNKIAMCVCLCDFLEIFERTMTIYVEVHSFPCLFLSFVESFLLKIIFFNWMNKPGFISRMETHKQGTFTL